MQEAVALRAHYTEQQTRRWQPSAGAAGAAEARTGNLTGKGAGKPGLMSEGLELGEGGQVGWGGRRLRDLGAMWAVIKRTGTLSKRCSMLPGLEDNKHGALCKTGSHGDKMLS